MTTLDDSHRYKRIFVVLFLAWITAVPILSAQERNHGLVGLRPLPRTAKMDHGHNHGGSWAGTPTFEDQKGNYPFVAQHLDVIKGWLDGDFQTKRVFFEHYWGLSKDRDDLNPNKNLLIKTIREWETRGAVVEHILICREYDLAIHRGHKDAKPGPFKEDTRILYAKDFDDIRAMFQSAHRQKIIKHNNYKLIQLIQEPSFFARDKRFLPIMEKCDGIAYECHQFNRHWPLETGWGKPEKVVQGAKWTLEQNKEYIFYYGPIRWKGEVYYELMERDWIQKFWRAGLPKHHPRMHYYLNTFPHGDGRGRPVGPETNPHSVLGFTKWLIQEIKQIPENKNTPSTPSSKAIANELGSLRNAKVAIQLTDPNTQLTFFSSGMSKEQTEELARIAPNLKIVTGLTRKEALARAGEAHGIDARYATPEFLQKADKLVWVQVMSAGIDRYVTIDPLMKNDKIVLTNCRGVHGPAIADHAMAMLLTLTRNMRDYGEKQDEGIWHRGRTRTPAVALKGKTMLVVGLGGIGTEIAQRANAFGMRVIGTRRSDSPSPAFIAKVGKPKDLLKMLPEADVIALAVPLTPETKHMLNQKAFSAMKPGSYLINIARGKVIDTKAMLAALDSKKLAGACLDVTDPEPLPKGHRLWNMPNVIITPHVAGRSAVTTQRRAALLRENLRRFAAGEPLLNVVDKKLGY